MHSCNQMVHSYFARYSRNRKISAKNARYLPFLSDICLYLSKSHNWGGTNGLLSMPGGITGFFNIFSIDDDVMKYNEKLMKEDIDKKYYFMLGGLS